MRTLNFQNMWKLGLILSAVHEATVLTLASWGWCFKFIQRPLPLHTSYPWYNDQEVISWKIDCHWSVRSSQLRISHHLCLLASRSATFFGVNLKWSNGSLNGFNMICSRANGTFGTWPVIRHSTTVSRQTIVASNDFLEERGSPPLPTWAYQDAWVVITSKQPKSNSNHTAAWHTWTRTPPLNIA